MNAKMLIISKLKKNILAVILFFGMASVACAGTSLPDGVYTHLIKGVPNGISSVVAFTQVPVAYSGPGRLIFHVQAREAVEGPGNTGQNTRIGLQLYANSPFDYAVQVYWAQNNGSGAQSNKMIAQPGDTIKLTVNYNPAQSGYTIIAKNLTRSATVKLVYGTIVSPAPALYAFRSLIETQSIIDCDLWDPNIVHTVLYNTPLDSAQLRIRDLKNKVVTFNPSFQQLAAITCNGMPYESTVVGSSAVLGK